jgi:hypothetical protein
MAGPWEDYQQAAPSGGAGPWTDFSPPLAVAPSPKVAKDLGDAITVGLQSSSLGLALRGALPEQQLAEDAPWYQRLGAAAGGVVGDVPAGVVGAVAGMPGGPLGSGVGAFAAPMALREALVEAYSHNYASSWEGVWEISKAAMAGGTKGAVVGAATVAGGIGGRALAVKAVGGATGKVALRAAQTAQFGGELAAMTTAASALEGQLPTWQDFMDNALLIGGMKYAVHTAGKMRGIYADTGKTPAEIAADARRDPALEAEIVKPAMELPEAYRELALEQRVRAALDKDNGQVVLKSFVAESLGKQDSTLTGELVRYEYITDDVTAQAVIRTTAAAYKDQVEIQRRGKVPIKASVIDAMDRLKTGDLAKAEIGRADSPHEAIARATLARDSAVRAKKLLAEFVETPPDQRTLRQELEAQAAVQQFGLFYGELAGGVAEAARTLRVMKEIKRNPDLLGEAGGMLKAFEAQGRGVTDLALLSRVVNDPMQFGKAAQEMAHATTLEKVLEVYRANLFSGLMTHEANLMGNAMKFAVEIPENAIAATIEAGVRAVKGDPLSMAQYRARLVAPIVGWKIGARDAVIAAGEAVMQKEFIDGKVETYGLANKGVLGEYAGTVFGLLQGGDMLFRIPAERARAYVLAVDRVVKEGLHPDTMEGRAQVMLYAKTPQMGLTQAAAEAVAADIHKVGSEAVFAQRLGPRMEKMQQAIAGSPAQFVFPAFRTPVNLLSWSVQHIPGLNLLSGRWRNDFSAGMKGDAAALSRATSRVLIGSGLALLAYDWAKDGTITGSGVVDKEMRATKQAAGIQPNSFKIGGEYYSFERIEPVAKLFSLAADLAELNELAQDEEDKAKIALMMVAVFGNATVSTTYLSGLARSMKAVTDPGQAAEYFAEGFASGAVPKFIGQGVIMMDPYKREVDGMLDAIQSQLPVLRKKLLPKLDVWGAPVSNNRWFDVLPVAVTEASRDKTKTEAARLWVAIADAPRFMTEKGPFRPREQRIKLTEEQRTKFRELRGKYAYEILAPIVAHQDWERMPDFAKAQAYRDVFEDVAKRAKEETLPAASAERATLRDKIVDKIRKQSEEAAAK